MQTHHTTKKLLVMAGGTGGHVFPALAVAKELQQQGWQIHWLGTRDRMEAQLVPKHGIDIDFIQISGVKGKGILSLIKAPFAIIRATLQARKIIKQYQPNAVLGMGGYVSGPSGLAAKLCGIPIILHEQNAVAGLTNRYLAKIATKVMQAFPYAFAHAEVVGNPVRADFFTQRSPEEHFAQTYHKRRILVVGGSQGAQVLNKMMPLVAQQIGEQLEIYHQVGKGNVDNIKSLYPPNTDVTVSEFIDDMAQAYAWADIVISRSGALTVCEIAAVGVPAIFVPFQHQDKQQYLNAKYLADEGAAQIIEQQDLTADKVVHLIQQWSTEKLLNMAKLAKGKANSTAAIRVADAIKQYAKFPNYHNKEIN